MEIVDLTGNYIKHIICNQDLTSYQKSYPSLFRHYFRYWAERRNLSKTLNRGEVKKRLNLILSKLSRVEKKIKKYGLDISSLKIVLFVGQNTSNGHAFRDGSDLIVWIPIETYSTPLMVDVFVTHEIIHALHYLRSPDFYFNTVAEKRSVLRQLITEGIATYLTKHIMRISQAEALWADFLSKQKIKAWLKECRQKEKELCKFVLNNFSSTSPELALFYSSNPRNIYEYRAGYFLGLRLVDLIVRTEGINPDKLLKIPRKRFEKMILKELKG
jgi:uncharacterized protein YjaZ